MTRFERLVSVLPEKFKGTPVPRRCPGLVIRVGNVLRILNAVKEPALPEGVLPPSRFWQLSRIRNELDYLPAITQSLEAWKGPPDQIIAETARRARAGVER